MSTIDKVYKIVKTNKKIFFEKIWTEINGTKEFDSKGKELEARNDLYTELLVDHRFVMITKDEWSLREFYSIGEIQEIMNNNYHIGEIEDPTKKEAPIKEEKVAATKGKKKTTTTKK